MSLLEAGRLHPNVAAGGAGPGQEAPREGEGPKELLSWCFSPATHTPGRKVAELRGGGESLACSGHLADYRGTKGPLKVSGQTFGLTGSPGSWKVTPG